MSCILMVKMRSFEAVIGLEQLLTPDFIGTEIVYQGAPKA